MERFFKTVKEKLGGFDGDIDQLMEWYKGKRPHMSLNLDVIETPHQAFIRKMPEAGTVVDEEPGEVYHSQKSLEGVYSFRDSTSASQWQEVYVSSACT